MTRSLYVNAASLPTTIRGGAHRHVGMIMKDTLYTTIAATVWDQSGTLAALVFPNNTMGGHCEQLKQGKDKQHRIFDNATNMDEAFKNQIIEEVDDTCILELKGKNTTFMGVMTKGSYRSPHGQVRQDHANLPQV